MNVKTEQVTPKRAKSFLANNTNNRKVNKNQLNLLVRTMKAGGWKLTHQGIAIYDDGSIADGQHRLMAVVESGVTCSMSVTYGLKKTAGIMMALDSGRQRTVAESISMTGDKITPAMVTIAKGLEFGYTQSMKKITPQETAQLCKKYSELLTLSLDILSAKKASISMAPVKVAILDCVTDGVKHLVAAQFYKALITGEYNEEIYINAIKLRNKFMMENHAGSSQRAIAYAMTYNTLMSTMAGKFVNRLSKATPEIKDVM